MKLYNAYDFWQEQFISIPAPLFTDERFSDVSLSEIAVYAYLYNRMRLSLANPDNFSDEKGLYVIFRQEELAQILHKQLRTIERAFSRLKEHGLIETERQGTGQPSKIYLANIHTSDVSGLPVLGDGSNPSCETVLTRHECRRIYRNKILEKDNRKDISSDNTKKRKRFVKPTLEEVQAYIDEKGFTFTAERFIDYYESNGWMVGRTHMKDWKATCRNWQRRRDEKPAGGKKQTSRTISDWDSVDISKGWDA